MKSRINARRIATLACSLALAALFCSPRGTSAQARTVAFGTGAPAKGRVPTALQVGTPQNLTNDAALESWPSVVGTGSGDILVAWQQNVPVKAKVQQDIFVRTAPGGGPFNPSVDITNDPWNSREPDLVNTTAGVYAFFQESDPTTVKFKIEDSILSNGTWSAPALVFNSPTFTAFDASGVQTTDGNIWVAWQNGGSGSGTWTDALVEQLGQKKVDLSNDGSAIRHPAIAAGANGQLYVAWADDANESPGVKPGVHVRQWNGIKWSTLPLPNNLAESAYPSLAYFNGNLYLVWRQGYPTRYLKERVWNGTAWSATTDLANGLNIVSPRIVIPPSGNIYITWANNGVIYLKKNSDPPVVVSGTVTGALNPSLYVDGNDVAYIVFQNGKKGGTSGT